MTTLYEILTGALGEDISKDHTRQDILTINDWVGEKARNKIGIPEFEKLERYIINNKDDSDLQFTMVSSFVDISDRIAEWQNDENFEARATYLALMKIYKKLETHDYDASLAALE